jgi:hypothetical protein
MIYTSTQKLCSALRTYACDALASTDFCTQQAITVHVAQLLRDKATLWMSACHYKIRASTFAMPVAAPSSSARSASFICELLAYGMLWRLL